MRQPQDAGSTGHVEPGISMPPDWWRTFFTGLAAEFWRTFPTPAMTQGEADFALQQLQPGTGARLLDVPCGDGRHAREMTRRGHRVVGVDASASLLAHARAAGGGVEYREGDMRELPVAEFTGACCLGNSFGYLGDPGDLQFLRAVRSALRDGGRFLLDAAVLETLLPAFQPRRWYQAGDIFFLSDVRFDPSTGIVRSDYMFLRGTEIERRSAFLQVRSTREILVLLREAGFRAARAIDQNGAPLQLGGQRAYFVAEA
jgi:SAM-dependent methyltransferase